MNLISQYQVLTKQFHLGNICFTKSLLVSITILNFVHNLQLKTIKYIPCIHVAYRLYEQPVKFLIYFSISELLILIIEVLTSLRDYIIVFVIQPEHLSIVCLTSLFRASISIFNCCILLVLNYLLQNVRCRSIHFGFKFKCTDRSNLKVTQSPFYLLNCFLFYVV